MNEMQASERHAHFVYARFFALRERFDILRETCYNHTKSKCSEEECACRTSGESGPAAERPPEFRQAPSRGGLTREPERVKAGAGWQALSLRSRNGESAFACNSSAQGCRPGRRACAQKACSRFRRPALRAQSSGSAAPCGGQFGWYRGF